MRRESKWTSVYCDANKADGFFHYVRFTPDFMNLEAAGFPHGLSIGGTQFKSKEEAEKFADAVDGFMEKMFQGLKEDIVGSLSVLVKAATGEVSHVYAGLCPDAVEGPNSRDNECEVCNAIVAAEQFLKD